jgi:hypothetical protein
MRSTRGGYGVDIPLALSFGSARGVPLYRDADVPRHGRAGGGGTAEAEINALR